jgi:hypothetical protein
VAWAPALNSQNCIMSRIIDMTWCRAFDELEQSCLSSPFLSSFPLSLCPRISQLEHSLLGPCSAWSLLYFLWCLSSVCPTKERPRQRRPPSYIRRSCRSHPRSRTWARHTRSHLLSQLNSVCATIPKHKPPKDGRGFRDFYHTGRILFYNSRKEKFVK